MNNKLLKVKCGGENQFPEPIRNLNQPHFPPNGLCLADGLGTTVRTRPGGRSVPSFFISHFARHPPFYLENSNLHFRRHHRPFPPQHPSLRPSKETLPFLSPLGAAVTTAAAKFNPNHPMTITGRKTRTATSLTGFYSLVLLFSAYGNANP